MFNWLCFLFKDLLTPGAASILYSSMPRRRSRSSSPEDLIYPGLKAFALIVVLFMFVPASRTYLLTLACLLVACSVGYVFFLFKAKKRNETRLVGLRPIPSGSQSVTSLAHTGNVRPTTIKDVLIHNDVLVKLSEIDWYQFEKFCAALLQAQGWSVERKGGAQPDGGVDLIATKGDITKLIQCKHWKTWNVQERVVRELLGSMAHYKVTQGAIYTFKGATRPAKEFARQDGVEILDATELASQALGYIEHGLLLEILSNKEHHCPKCEAQMIWRTGNFEPFWGCQTYPRCRGVIKGG